MPKVIWVFTGFSLMCFVIGSETRATSSRPISAKLKQIAAWLSAFSRAQGLLPNSQW